MKKLLLPLVGGATALLLAAAVVAAAEPTPAPAATPTPTTTPYTWHMGPPVAANGAADDILGLTQTEIMTLRQSGLSLAQIAEQQKVDPQKLIDALVAQWGARIDARVAVGAITADQATTLKANLAVQAKAMVYQVALGGMRGAAVGAGPSGAGRGMGGMRGGMMGRGFGTGTGTCPACGVTASPAPAS